MRFEYIFLKDTEEIGKYGKEVTYNSEISPVLTSDDLLKAIDCLKKNNDAPFITCIKCKYDFVESFKKYPVVRNFSLYGMIEVHQDDSIPEGIARFVMSDGTFNDYEVNNKPNYIFTNN